MDFMLQSGFLDTRAPLFMDIVTLIVSILPLLMLAIIYQARVKRYKLHALLQRVLFLISFGILVYFETGVRVIGGFDFFMKGSGVGHNYAFVVLVFHIAIAIATLIVWITTLIMVKKQLHLQKHKKAGKIVFLGVILTSLTGIWVYLLMFVY
jgi:putative membrane protein